MNCSFSLLPIFSFCALLSFAAAAETREIGAVSTAFKLVGPNHKIEIVAFDDPAVKGITCYIARPKTGGIKGAIGVAEDPSIASVSCVQTGPVSYVSKINLGKKGEEVFDEDRSLIFKSLKVNRLYDTANGSLIYVTRTKRIIEGSPDTSIAVVTPVIWNGVAPGKPEIE